MVLADVPDPRRARGKRHAWALLLTLVGLALASGARSMEGVVRRVAERREDVSRQLQPPRGVLPSAATRRRAVRAVDCAALEARGAACHLLSVVRQADGCVLGQVAVGAKTNEVTAVPGLLAGRYLSGSW